VDFVLMLHSHLPYVLSHGRWPHGSDWLCEAALGAYLPLAGKLRQLERGDVQAPVTLGVTPVLANQLAHPAFAAELDRYIAQRLAACAETASAMAGTPEAPLLPLVAFWERRLGQLRTLRDELGGDLIGEFRRLQGAGRLELTSSAATHAILPLLARDESIRLQLLRIRKSRRSCRCELKPRSRMITLASRLSARLSGSRLLEPTVAHSSSISATLPCSGRSVYS
jgi:1,4-alpha-glucan branching enzyme